MKRITIVFLAIALCLCVTGCGKLLSNSKDSASQTTSVIQFEDALQDVSSKVTQDASQVLKEEIITSSDDLVVDAFYYEKNVIPVEGMEGYGYEELKHSIKLPKITKETANTKALNEKIYNLYVPAVNSLKNNQEGSSIISVEYAYKVYNDLLGITVIENAGVQAGGGSSTYYVYYFDLKNDKELSLEEYLSALNLDKETLLTKIKATKEYREHTAYMSGNDDLSIKDCIVDKDGAMAILYSVNTMDGWYMVECGPIL